MVDFTVPTDTETRCTLSVEDDVESDTKSLMHLEWSPKSWKGEWWNWKSEEESWPDSSIAVNSQNTAKSPTDSDSNERLTANAGVKIL